MSESKIEGTLKKWVNCFEGWKDRYFILKDNVLNYYIEKGARVKGKIHVAICEITVDNKNLRRFEINTGTKNIFLETYEIEECKSWHDALNSVKKRGQLITKPPVVDTTKFTHSDIKILKRLFTTKELVENLIKSNKNITELLSSDEINTVALRGFTDSYKVNINIF